MPSTPRSAYDPKRTANTLLLNQVRELEKAVKQAGRGVKTKKPRTEAQVAVVHAAPEPRPASAGPAADEHEAPAARRAAGCRLADAPAQVATRSRKRASPPSLAKKAAFAKSKRSRRSMNGRAIALSHLCSVATQPPRSLRRAVRRRRIRTRAGLAPKMRLQREHLAGELRFSSRSSRPVRRRLVTGHPFHVSFGSIAPLNGFGGGPAIVTHFTPKNWRHDLERRRRICRQWRVAGRHVPQGVSHEDRTTAAGEAGRARRDRIRITEYPVYTVYAQTISLPSLAFYGIGSDTSVADKTIYGMSETIIGGNATIPLGKVVPPLKAERCPRGQRTPVRHPRRQLADVPLIGTVFTEPRRPGSTAQPSYRAVR